MPICTPLPASVGRGFFEELEGIMEKAILKLVKAGYTIEETATIAEIVVGVQKFSFTHVLIAPILAVSFLLILIIALEIR